jgi:hypothetical protein
MTSAKKWQRGSAIGPTTRFDRGPANDCHRRLSPVAVAFGRGLLSDPIAAAEPGRRQPLNLPKSDLADSMRELRKRWLEEPQPWRYRRPRYG